MLTFAIKFNASFLNQTQSTKLFPIRNAMCLYKTYIKSDPSNKPGVQSLSTITFTVVASSEIRPPQSLAMTVKTKVSGASLPKGCDKLTTPLLLISKGMSDVRMKYSQILPKSL